MNDIRITQIKLKLIEGEELTLQEQQILCEVAPMLLFSGWLRQKAMSWIKDQIAQAVKGQIVAKDQLAQADQAIAAALGAEDKEMGSTLTAFVMSLIQTGNPVQAAIQTGVAAAKEYAMKASGAKDAIDTVKTALTTTATSAVQSALAPNQPAGAGTQTAQAKPDAKADPMIMDIKQFTAQLEPIADQWEAAVEKVQPPANAAVPKLG